MTFSRFLSTAPVKIGLTLLVLAGAIHSTSVRADIDALQPAPGFSYETGRWTEVDIALTSNNGAPALLSIYSKGENGLRLLQNAFTDVQGRFVGELQLRPTSTGSWSSYARLIGRTPLTSLSAKT